jgi:hypothetical protein
MDQREQDGGLFADLKFYAGLMTGTLVIGLVFYVVLQLGISL